MKTERELFLEWHFLDWKLHNAVTDTVDFAKVLYDRVYSHDHTSSAREVEFKAWQASASREGYKFVPVEPTEDMIMAGFMEHGGYDVIDSKLIYKSMIEAVEK